MKTKPDVPGREPDLQVILKEHLGIIKETMTEGPADIVIEIVSKESRARDTIDKFDEYREGGVREYWVIDPERQQPDFYALDDDGLYRRIELQNGVFRSSVLSRFSLDTAVLWNTEVLEDDEFIRTLVAHMLKEG